MHLAPAGKAVRTGPESNRVHVLWGRGARVAAKIHAKPIRATNDFPFLCKQYVSRTVYVTHAMPATECLSQTTCTGTSP